MIKEIRDWLVIWKFRISYFSGFLTAFAAIIIISNTVQEKINILGIGLNYFVVLSVVFVCVICGAYILDRLGFVESEISYSNSKNKILNEIRDNNDKNK